MSDRVETLEREIRRHILYVMPDPSGDLAGMDWPTLLHTYLAWRARFIVRRPRRIHMSNALQANARVADYQPAFDALMERIRVGDDLTPHLSSAVRVAYEPTGRGSDPIHRRRDRDLLLADWGIHHLHVATAPGRNGFVKRTSDVLFGFFRSDDAYLVDLCPHPRDFNWAARRILEITVRSWPDAELVWRSDVAVDLTQHYTDAARLRLRQAGVNVGILIDDKVYMPQGMTGIGTPMRVARRVMHARASLDAWRDSTALDAELAASEARFPDAASGDEGWVPCVDGDQYGFRRNQLLVVLGSLD